MKSQSEIEQVLERLGKEWPADSALVDGVMRGIESQRVRPRVRSLRWPLTKALLATAASLVVLTILWWNLHSSKTLAAQVIDGIHKARTLHMTRTSEPTPDKPVPVFVQSWFARGIGFREEVGSEVRLGNQEFFWTYVKDSTLATRSKSRGINEIVDNMLSDEHLQRLKDEQPERYPAGDQKVDGQSCHAYLLTTLKGAGDPDLKTGKKRMVMLLDDQSRMVRVIIEVRSDDRWIKQLTSDWKYDEPIDPALFEPRFGDDVKIVDADAVFEGFVDLQTALHHEERAGLIYAIHHVERFEGGILVVSSVRGTEETLKEYPLTQRRLRPGLFFMDGPAEHYGASQGRGFFRIDLASADHHGINVGWWVLVPRGRRPYQFDIAPGKVMLPVGITPKGAFAKAKFADADGVIDHLTWDVVLDLPEAKSLPTLEAITKRVYADQIALEAVPFGLLDMGPNTIGKRFTEARRTTAAEFSKAVAAHIQYWKEKDGAR